MEWLIERNLREVISVYTYILHMCFFFVDEDYV